MSDAKDIYKKLRERSAYYDYFFNKISSPKLLGELKENGFFETATQAKRKDGYVSYPAWAPATYLIKVADQEPKKVMDIILAIKPTDNQFVHYQFIEAALKMPPDEAVRLASKVRKWLAAPNKHLIPDQTAKMVKHLYDGGQKDAAIKLSKQLLAVRGPVTESEKVFEHAHAIIGYHEMTEFIENQFADIFKDDPETAAPLLIDALRAALGYRKTVEVEKDGLREDYSEIWLPNFGNHTNSTDAEVILAIKLYNLTTELDITDKKKVVQLLDAEKFKVFKRMAVALIGPDNPDKELAAIYDAYVKQHGEPLSEHTYTSWVGPESPLSAEEISKMSTESIIAYMNDWKPSGQIMTASKEGLGYQLNQLVMGDPDKGSDILRAGTAFKNEYLSYIMNGFERAAVNKLTVDWPPVFEFIKSYIAENEDLDDELLLSFLRALEGAANADQVDLTDEEYRKLYIDLVEIALRSKNPSFNPDDDPFNASSSPDIGGINSVRGVALHTLIHFMMRASRQSGDDTNQLALFNEAELTRIQQLLSQHVEIKSEPSFAVRTAYTHNLPYLFTSLSDWTKANISNIFPKDKDDYFRVNVESLLRYGRVYGPLVPLIRPALLEYLKRIKSGKVENVDAETMHQLTSKLMIYYLNAEIEIDDELLQALFQLDPKWPAEAIEFIGRELKQLNVSENEDLFERAKALWDYRAPNATPEECAAFGTWFICDGFDLEWRKSNFIAALKKTPSIELVWQVLDWLKAHATTEPLLVAEVFDEIVRTQSDETLHFTLIRDIEGLLQVLYDAQISEVDEVISSAVNSLFIKHLGDYRKFKRAT